MTALTDRIRERGHWRIAIRPERYVENRVELIHRLFPLVEGAAVEIRGWDFPHIDRTQAPHIDVDWVGQESEWQHHLEAWRLYMSGQFIDVAGFPSDWRDQSAVWPADGGWEAGKELGVGEVVYKLTEIVEFGARLALSEVGDAQMYMGIIVGGLSGRQLIIDDPRKVPFMHPYVCEIEELPLERSIEREDLVGRPREVSVEFARELFARFGWNPSAETLLGFLRPW